jgi:four helix bundle protein
MEQAEFSSYRDLVVWQLAVELAVAAYNATKPFPPSEMYGLTSQIRRAATSVSANIAEGYGRDSPGSFQQFLKVAQGSLKELETHLIIAEKVGLLLVEDRDVVLQHTDRIGKMLKALIRKVASRA